MQAAGVHLASALPIGNPLLRSLKGRIDLRNHRKILVIDNRITYCGSQNCADPEFRIKARYAPWVDAMLRIEGPIARQNQYLFASDWESETGETISQLLRQPIPAAQPGLPAQVVGTGPTVRYSAMPEMFETLMYAARHELVITTPYYVPDESMQAGLCASARRGVDTTIVFPARNDSWIVAAASRSYYADLLAAGVHIFEYEGGLLHTKSLTLMLIRKYTRLVAACAVAATPFVSTAVTAEGLDGSSDAVCAVTHIVACLEDGTCLQGQAKIFDLPELVVLDARNKVLRGTHESGHKEVSPDPGELIREIT